MQIKVYGTKTALDKFQKKYPRQAFLRTWINNWVWNIASDDKLQKKKGITNILLLDFGLFSLYEIKFTINFGTQKDSWNVGVWCMKEFLPDWNIMPFQIIFIAVCDGFYFFSLYVYYILFSRSTKSIERGITT